MTMGVEVDPPDSVLPDEEELFDVTELIESVEVLSSRVESMDRALYRSIRGLASMMRLVETVINPMNEPEAKARALQKLNEMLNAMEKL